MNPHARHAHQPARCLVSPRLHADTLVEHGLRRLDLLMHDQQPFDDRTQDVLVVQEPEHMGAELSADRPWEQ